MKKGHWISQTMTPWEQTKKRTEDIRKPTVSGDGDLTANLISNRDRPSSIVGRWMILVVLVLVDFSMPSKIRHNGEVPATAFNFASKGYSVR